MKINVTVPMKAKATILKSLQSLIECDADAIKTFDEDEKVIERLKLELKFLKDLKKQIKALK